MKNFITMAVSLFSLTMCAQVGINTTAPKASLDVTANTTDGSKPEGLIAPRLTGDQIQAGDAQYGTAQKGTILYATSAATSPSTKTANITAEGYYYFDGSTWQIITGVATTGDPTNDAWINDTANSMVKLGTKSDGTVRTAGTDIVAKDNGSVGIGTNAPDINAALDVNSSDKGFLPPRVSLTSTTSSSPLAAHVQGMLVYNTATAGAAPTNVTPGIYFNDGTSWKQFTTSGQKASSYFGSVDYGDIKGGTYGLRPVTGFIISADKISTSSTGDDLVITHNLNLTGNQNITVTILSNVTGNNYSQYNFDNDWFQPVIHDITANSFSVFIEENFPTVQNVSMMIQLTNY